MSTELLWQIDTLENACHAALRSGDDMEAINVLVRTLTTVRLTVSAQERPIVRGLANLASTHADMLLSALNSGPGSAVVHDGLTRVCRSLGDLREAIQDEPPQEHRATP